MLDRSQAEKGEVQFDCRLHLVLHKNSPVGIVVFLIVSLFIHVCWLAEILGFIHPVLVLPDAEPFDQILGALKFGMKAVLLTFEPSHILHRHKYHLLLAERVFGFDLQLLDILVSDLRSFSGAPALVGFCVQEV